MFFYGITAIPFYSLSNKSRNSKMFTHSEFKMTLSFAITGSIGKQKFYLWIWRNWSTCTYSGIEFENCGGGVYFSLHD